MGNVSLKVLEFFVQKRVRTLVLTLEEFDTTSNVTWSLRGSSHICVHPFNYHLGQMGYHYRTTISNC